MALVPTARYYVRKKTSLAHSQMGSVSGYRDPLMEFSEAMAQWYRCFQNKRNRDKHAGLCGYGSPHYSMDRSPYWILHLLGDTTPPPAARARLEQADIDLSELENSDQSVLMVTDASGLPLGFDALPRGWAVSLGGGEAAGGDGEGRVETIQSMVGLLRHCMEAPMSGGPPRRPHTLRVNDRKLHRLLDRSSEALSILKVVLWPQALGDWGPTQVEDGAEDAGGLWGSISFSMRWPPTRYCHVCKKHSFSSQLNPCSQCKALLYCSDKSCCSEDCSHQHRCDRLAAFMTRKAQLADMPFCYATEVTADDFDLEHFLSKNKLDSGYWLHWSLCVRSARYELQEQSGDPHVQWLKGHSDPYGPLKKEGEILLSIPGRLAAPSLTKPLVSWRQYCEWRGLGLSSLFPPLLSSSLSIYYIITSLVPRDFPEMNVLNKRSLKIHIVESYREFHTLMAFWELSILLPHVTFELVFIGKSLPLGTDEEQLVLQKENGSVTLVKTSLTPDKKSIRVKGYRRAYDTFQGPKPDLVIGFRPMIPLCGSWLGTLRKLQALRVPAYFCEVSELSCECSQQVMNQATGGALSPAHINPFHCPLRLTGGDNLLPSYSNAFIFHLMYKPLVGLRRPVPAAPRVPPPEDLPAKCPQKAPQKFLNRKDRKRAARKGR